MSQTYLPYTRSRVQGEWNLTPANLLPALQAAFPNNVVRVRCNDDQVTVELEPADNDWLPGKAGLDTVINDLVANFDPLPICKAKCIKAIRDRTDELIAQGAIYNGVVYMSTDEGRFDVLGLFSTGVVVHDDGSWASVASAWPESISATDGESALEFNNAAEFAPFFQAMLGTYKYWKTTSKALRQQVADATTCAEVNAIVDDRTWPAPI